MFLQNDVNEHYDHFSDKVYAAGSLDKKTKELIAVACSVMADCLPCLEWHYKQAVLASANQDAPITQSLEGIANLHGD